MITFLVFTLAHEVGQNVSVQKQGKDRELLYLMFSLVQQFERKNWEISCMVSIGLSPHLLDLLQLRIWLETIFFLIDVAVVKLIGTCLCR